METRANHVLVGAFVLIILAGIVGATIWLARLQFDKEFAYYDIFFTGSVTGLATGAPVRYNGIQIGQVEDIQLDPSNVERVRVTAKVDYNAPIKTDAIAQLEVQGITGYAFVQISSGSRDAEPLMAQEGQRYPVITSRASSLQQVFMSAPQLLERAVLVVDRIADVLNDGNRRAVAETLVNLRDASAMLNGKDGEINNVLVEATATIRELRVTLATVNRTLATISQSVDTATRSLVGKDGVSDQVGATLAEYAAVARRLGESVNQIDGLLKENRPAVRDFAQRGLTELNQLFAEARGLVSGLARLAGEIERDPARFFFSDRRDGYRPK